MKLPIMLCSLWLLGVTTVYADLYQWTDAQGVTHVVDDSGTIPEAYREAVTVYHTAKPTTTSASLLAPSRTYPEKSQGAFAQKLALDLGLIKTSAQDALGPLGAAGIQPAGGWRGTDPLTAEAQAEVAAAARRAANSQRLRVSADGAEAIVQQTALAFLLPPPVMQEETSYEEEAEYYQEPEIIIEQQPPQIIEIIREPVYIPQPVIVGTPHRREYHRRRHHRQEHREKRFERPRRSPREQPSRQASGFSTPAPTHMPFGASHMPFGASHMPFGSNRSGR